MSSTQIRERSLSSKDGSVPSPTLIIGLGNPILGDDGVGWRVAEQVAQKIKQSTTDPESQLFSTEFRSTDEIEIDYLAVGGLSLMERLIGYDRVIIIDAIQTGRIPVGEVIYAALEELSETYATHLTSAHDMSLSQALIIGRSMGAHLPKEIIIVGVEARSVYDFSEDLSAPISAALPKATNLVIELIIRWQKPFKN
jgi:hydrogenase maturation protease